jgi:hypothetical protein
LFVVSVCYFFAMMIVAVVMIKVFFPFIDWLLRGQMK